MRAVSERASGWHDGRVTTGSDKSPWVEGLPKGEPLKEGLARLVDEDQDEAEVEHYERVADPTFVAVERARRRYRGMFKRRLRRRRDRS